MKTWILLLLSLTLAAPFALSQTVSATGEPVISRSQAMQVLTPRSAGFLDETWTNIDPGVAPEGDYIGGTVFTPDGSRIISCNRATDNVTIFDWQTMQPLANVHVGRWPGAVAATDSIAVVACAFGNRVYFINLANYTVLDSLDAGEQPWVVRLSPDNHYAYVACDIPNVCEVYDLTNRTHVRTISNFPISLYQVSWNSASGRNDAGFTDFVVTPDGQELVTGRCDSVLLFINPSTGEVDDSIVGIHGCLGLALSGDSTKLIALSPMNPPIVYQIELQTHAVLDSVTLTGRMLSIGYGVCANQDGSKCFLGLDNYSAVVHFATHDFNAFNTCYAAFWLGVTPDHRYAVSGQFNFCLVDFETETVVSHLQGHPGWHGAVSPSSGHAVGFSPFDYEGPCFYDITTPTNATYRGQTPSGSSPEGDAPRFVAIAPDGSKAVTTNFLSNNLSIVDLTSLETEAVVSAGDQPWGVAITPDSRYAIVCGCMTNSVLVVDLQSDSVVAEVGTGGRSVAVAVSPTGDYAYVTNLVSNTVSVIAIDGANSSEVAQISCPGMGVMWASYGCPPGLAVSPSGRWVLVPAIMTGFVHVIDTETNTLAATLNVGGTNTTDPTQVVFAGCDSIAMVANFGTNNVAILHIDGENSTVAGTYSVGNNTAPLRLAYDPTTDQVGIGLYYSYQVKKVNPHTGAVVLTHSFATYGPVVQVAYNARGDETVLTAGLNTVPAKLHRGTFHTDLPAGPCSFAMSANGAQVAIAQPGPDFVTVVDYGAENAPGVRNVAATPSFRIDATYPNPFNPAVNIRYSLAKDATVALRAFDALGRQAGTIIQGWQTSGQHDIVWDAHGMPSGPYWIRLEAAGTRSTMKVVLLK